MEPLVKKLQTQLNTEYHFQQFEALEVEYEEGFGFYLKTLYEAEKGMGGEFLGETFEEASAKLFDEIVSLNSFMESYLNIRLPGWDMPSLCYNTEEYWA